MKKEQWFLTTKRADFNALAKELSISPILARLIRNRDITDVSDMRTYLYGSLADLGDPFLLKDVEKGAGIIRDRIRAGRRIRIISDYDVDGVSSNYILYMGLKRCGADVDYRIPDRIQDGYGINEQLIRQAHEDGIDTIITCDNGIAAADQIALGNELGMTFVITDHHDVPYEIINHESVCEKPTDAGESADAGRVTDAGESVDAGRVADAGVSSDVREILPDAAAVINPKQRDCPYPFKNICGAVVAWKFIQVLYSLCGIDRVETEEFLEIAALATVCDVMPLKGENRIIVKEGLARMKRTSLPGIQALIEENRLMGKEIKAWHLGFVIGPCINASGRLSTAKTALELLLCRDPLRCHELASDLVRLNEERKEMTRKGEEDAERWLAESGHAGDKVLVVYLPDCHESIAGIIAGRVRENHNKPVFVLTKGGSGVKGSGRSIEAYHMYQEMTRVKECFDQYGGHPMAAGLSMSELKIEELRTKLNENTTLQESDFVEKVSIDIALPVGYLSESLIREFDRLEPFGTDNRKPLFAQKDLCITGVRELGDSGRVLKLFLKDEKGYPVEAIYFGQVGDFFEDVKEAAGAQELSLVRRGLKNHISLSCTYYPEINEWRGNKSIQIVIRNYRIGLRE